MYTRLPMWRVAPLEAEDYARAVQWWPAVGFVTGGLMALIAWGLEGQLPQVVIIILALCGRLLLTGAFHEDGLGDFFDGFGGGRTKERVLEIMKDSHVGSYAVVGYVIYYLLLVAVLASIPASILPGLMIIADVCGRVCSVQQVHFLPYARTLETSKTGVVYQGRMSLWPIVSLLAAGWLALELRLVAILPPPSRLCRSIPMVCTTPYRRLYGRHPRGYLFAHRARAVSAGSRHTLLELSLSQYGYTCTPCPPYPSRRPQGDMLRAKRCSPSP